MITRAELRQRPRLLVALTVLAGVATAVPLVVLLIWITGTLDWSAAATIAALLGLVIGSKEAALVKRTSWRSTAVAVVAAAAFYAGRHLPADLTIGLLGLATGRALAALWATRAGR